MKLRNIFYTILCGLAITTGFTACSDDEEEWNPTGQGSKIEMAQTRGFILNEGSYQLNNTHINYFNYATDGIVTTDLYKTQNGKELGDTGQDLIEYDGNLYVVVYGSKYIAKLNGVGVEQCRYSFATDATIGDPRYAVGQGGYIYVTTYGGYVVKLNASDLSYVGKVQVGKNPEHIVESDGYIYCTNSGWGEDNRLSIINEKTFTCENVEIMTNPDGIAVTDNGTIFIQGYGANYEYPLQKYDKSAKTATNIGNASSIVAYKNILYVCYSQTNWTTYETTNTFYTYNAQTNSKGDSFLKDAPSELTTASVYGLSVNAKTGHIYVLVTNYTSGDGIVYHFDNNGKYVGKFSSGGQNPKKIVFVD